MMRTKRLERKESGTFYYEVVFLEGLGNEVVRSNTNRLLQNI